MGDLPWLKSMFKRELDLRPPSLARIGKNSIFIRDDMGNPIAHATISNRWQGCEINSVVVDSEQRGKGLSHKLLEILGQGRVFAYTRDSRLRSALLKAGFKRALYPGILATLNMIIGRTAMMIWMIITLEFKRIFHQFKNMFSYKLYIRQ
jgi:GNAT superfamily N-acetyltransferase